MANCNDAPTPVALQLNPEVTAAGAQDYTRAWRTVSQVLSSLQVSLFNLQTCVNTISGGATPSASVTAVGPSNVVGVSPDYSRGDHIHAGVSDVGGATGSIIVGTGLTLTGHTLSASGGGSSGIVCALILSGAAPQAFPALLQEWLNSDLYRNQFDMTGYTEARLVVVFPMSSPTPILPPNISAQYSLNGGISWSYLDGGTGPTVGYNTGGTAFSSWITIAAPAIAAPDVLLRIVGANGDGITSLSYGNVAIEVRP